jgi:hypothetical protein
MKLFTRVFQSKQDKLEIPSVVAQWQFGGKSGNLRAQNTYNNNEGYTLFCTDNKQYFTYAKPRFGINVGFARNNNDRKIHLRLPSGREEEIRTGDLIAFGLGGGDAFFRYAKRTVGINLEYSKNPVFEWRIFDETGEIGRPIAMGTSVAIVNINVKPSPDFFIYFERPAGANVGWTTSPGWWDKVKELTPLAKQALELALVIISQKKN